MVQKILSNKFRISEFIQFFKDVLKLCNQNADAAALVSDQLIAFQASTDKLSETFKVKQASDVTVQLSSIDSQRDQGIICLRKMADAFASHIKEDLKTAGTQLLSCIDKYGARIYTLNYQAETSTLSNLCNDLTNNADMLAVVEKLNLTDLVTSLSLLNEQFNDLYLTRVTEDSADESISSGEAVKQARNDYQSLTDHLEAYSIISPSEGINILLAELNTLIGKYNTTMELRSAKSGSDDTDEEGEDEPTDDSQPTAEQ